MPHFTIRDGAGIFPWAVAFVLVALLPALPVLIVAQASVAWTAFMLALIYAVVFGLPVVLAFRVKRWTHLGAAIAGGFLVGIVPVFVFGLVVGTSTPSGMAVWADAIPSIGLVLAIFGGFGAAGGLVFWLTLRWFGVLIADQATPPPRA
jgi:hypothetical protein